MPTMTSARTAKRTATRSAARTTAAAKADGRAPFLTARNPYALTEVILGEPVDWSTVEDPLALVEETLATPREELFDPKFDSPVYLGFRLDDAGEMVEAPIKAPRERPSPESDDSAVLADDPRILRDLQPLLGELGEATVRGITASRAGGWTIEIAPGGTKRTELLERIIDKSVLDRLVRLVDLLDLGWTPDGGQWADTGSFFNEAAEYFDPVQGALGDCWLIAAMSSVAWALPGTITDAARATGIPNDRFKHRLIYRDPGDGSRKTFEVSDETVVYQGTSYPMYARSSEANEIWPPVVEKAFAQWRQGTSNDHPNLTVLNGGDPVWASAALSGRSPQYFGHSGRTASDLRTLVKSHSASYRTFDPMTAWTYGTAPEGLSYADAHIVGCHAYSVLGWTSGPFIVRAFEGTLARASVARRAVLLDRFGFLLDPIVLTRDYVVLRNPWGSYEATTGNRTGVISMRDEGFWRSIDLGDVDGVFAIDFSTYQRYFAGTGVAI
jgi:hypothetical protein